MTCSIVKSSGFHPIAPAGTAPVVTAASSQYFERTFNRLVAAPLQPFVPVAPALPVAPAPAPVIPVLPLPPPRPVIVDAKSTPVGVTPTNPSPPPNAQDPNIAIAVATAHAAAPVATILLPPYPFGLPPSFGFIPQSHQAPSQPTENPTLDGESTTRRTTTPQVTTTEREQEATTAVPSNIDNSFAQALPSNQDINFKQYLTPSPVSRPASVYGPQNVKTNVEVVPVPLAYIAPPPLSLHHHHHHQHHHHHHQHQHQALKAVPHIHTFIPKTRFIIRPVISPIRIRTVTIPAGFATYGPPKSGKKFVKRFPQNIKYKSNAELTTFRTLNLPYNKLPRP